MVLGQLVSKLRAFRRPCDIDSRNTLSFRQVSSAISETVIGDRNAIEIVVTAG